MYVHGARTYVTFYILHDLYIIIITIIVWHHLLLNVDIAYIRSPPRPTIVAVPPRPFQQSSAQRLAHKQTPTTDVFMSVYVCVFGTFRSIER